MDQLPERDETLLFWQARCSRPLSSEDARQITANVVEFFTVLQRWRNELPTETRILQSDK